MPENVLMPSLSPTMTQGDLVTWHKKVGDVVNPGDLLLEIQTDKAVMEVESLQEGIMHHILVEAPCEAVAVGTPLAILRKKNEKAEDVVMPTYAEKIQSHISSPDIATSAVTTTPAGTTTHAATTTTTDQVQTHPLCSEKKRIHASPLAKKIASLHKLSLADIVGTGPSGRIVKNDVEKALSATVAAKQNTPEVITEKSPEKVVLTGMRKTIAQRLTLSQQTVPHFYLTADCIVDDLLCLRTQLNTPQKRFSVNDFVLKASAMCLAAIPEMRLQWQNDHMIRQPHADVAMAVSLPEGLITPIIRKAETKTLSVIAAEATALAIKAKNNTLVATEYQGGTFTVSNMGMMGVEQFFPIINMPHAGILGVGAACKKVIVVEDAMVIRQVMTVTLAMDHRVVDGVTAAEFLRQFKYHMEHPYGMME